MLKKIVGSVTKKTGVISSLGILSLLFVEASFAAAPAAARLKESVPSSLSQCGGKISFTYAPSFLLKFKKVKNCSRVEVLANGMSHRLVGSQSERSGEVIVQLAEEDRSTVIVTSKSGKHRDPLQLRSRPSKDPLQLSECGGTVEIEKNLVTYFTFEDVRTCKNLIVEDTKNNKQFAVSQLSGSPGRFFGEFPFQLEEMSPSFLKVTVASNDRSYQDIFIPEMECEDEAIRSVLDELGYSDYYRSLLKVLPEGKSRQKNHKFTIIASEKGKTRSFYRTMKRNSCEVISK